MPHSRAAPHSTTCTKVGADEWLSNLLTVPVPEGSLLEVGSATSPVALLASMINMRPFERGALCLAYPPHTSLGCAVVSPSGGCLEACRGVWRVRGR